MAYIETNEMIDGTKADISSIMKNLEREYLKVEILEQLENSIKRFSLHSDYEAERLIKQLKYIKKDLEEDKIDNISATKSAKDLYRDFGDKIAGRMLNN